MTVGVIVLAAWGACRVSSSWIESAEVLDRKLAAAGQPSVAEVHPGAVFFDGDCYYWLGYARDTLNGQPWRDHHTNRDGPPGGRPVHWAFPFLGLLLAAAELTRWWTHEPVARALEIGACWVNPGLWIGLILAGSTLVWRRFGRLPAAIFAVAVVAQTDISWALLALRPDHQGLYLALSTLVILGVLAGGVGWVRRGKEVSPGLCSAGEARLWFVASAVVGGLDLWVSAAVAGFVLLSIFLTMLIWCALSGSLAAEPGEYRAELWRWWGRVGGGVCLFAYAVEYWPHLAGWRLEVNHPLYALEWIAMGEVLALATDRAFNGRRSPRWQTAAWLAILITGPALIFFGPASWHAMRDPYMSRLHEFITEFYNYPAFHKLRNESGTAWSGYWQTCGPLLLSLPIAAGLAFRGRLSLIASTLLWFVFSLSFFFLILSYVQVRWIAFAAMLLILLGVVTVALLERSPEGGGFAWPKWGGRALALGLLGWSAHIFHTTYLALDDVVQGRALPKMYIEPLLNKRMGLALKDVAEREPLRFVGTPDPAGAWQYFAGIPSVASLYWENLRGAYLATDFMAATDDAQAEQTAREAGLTHVVLVDNDRWVQSYDYVKTGRFDLAASQATLSGRLYRGEDWPGWLEEDFELQRLANRRYFIRGRDLGWNFSFYRIIRP